MSPRRLCNLLKSGVINLDKSPKNFSSFTKMHCLNEELTEHFGDFMEEQNDFLYGVI